MAKKIFPLNDQAITVSFGEDIDVRINRQVQQFYRMILNKKYHFIIDIVPTYTNVTMYFDKKQVSYQYMKNLIQENVTHLHDNNHPNYSRLIHIPVHYNGEDLARVANHNQLSKEEVIDLHVNEQYLIYMIGFLPGFPYLGGLNKRIATPRLDEPRPDIEPGSVGIANNQTGIYPVNSPGGWNIIGHTPIQIFDVKNENPFLLQAGDYIKFFPINQQTYDNILADEKYKPQVEWLDED